MKPVKLTVGNTSELCSDHSASAAHCVFSSEALRLEQYKMTLWNRLLSLHTWGKGPILMVCFCREGNLIFYCWSSDDLLSHSPRHTFTNHPWIGLLHLVHPGTPEVIEELSLYFWTCSLSSTGPWSQEWSLAALWHSTLILIGGTTSIRTGTEQKSIKLMPYPRRRASDLENKHGSIVFFITCSDGLPWTSTGMLFTVGFCVSPEHQRQKASLFGASRDWEQVENTM